MSLKISIKGTLWVVATPIGNLADLSPRAREVLAEAPILAAEDTRTSQKLVAIRQTPPRWVSLHEHNEESVVKRLIGLLGQGHDVALLCDAGTPLISDPGYRLIAAAHEVGIRVSPVPGPCAAIAALSAAGLATDRFFFEGFLPARTSARRRRLESLKQQAATLVFYVPARKLPKALADAAAAIGTDRLATVARELTKQFETIRRASLGELADWTAGDPDQQRGEAVLLISGAPGAEPKPILIDALARELAAELPPARAARVLSRVSELDRREAFALVEALNRKNS
ncbi:MAG: 16S rRNA (cytidine(1402)-2'-O)-methyltransferase [Xanthomonadaceae bacterium]|nr:16S rRNA (cytidine(1402)-2'-O)-methyltransferase [Xanthomonadaceae bacterium]